MNTYQHWTLTTQNHIATLTLNRPEQKNRIDETTLFELREIAHYIAGESDIWVVVVRANGTGFSAGVDVSLIGKIVGQDPESYRRDLKNAQDCFDVFEALNKPTIAAMHGYVIGGGMILAVCCDFRLATPDVEFYLPEVKRSIGVIMGTQRITRIIGVSATKEMAMLAVPVGAERALRLGLINEIVPQDQLDKRAQAFAEQFLELPPLAVGLNKQIIDQGQFLDRAGQDLEIERQEALLKSEDFKEAIASFFEKRKPIYKGK
ncbi:MAG: enoyl-CoA hydratase/isomerase family protein [Bacteroidota bacterium]